MQRGFGRRNDSPPMYRARSRSPLNFKPPSSRIIISNLPYSVSWQTVKELIRGETGHMGKVDLIARNGKPSGMASVEFNSPDVAAMVIKQLNGCFLDNRELQIRLDATPDMPSFPKYHISEASEELIHLMNYLAFAVMQKLQIPGPLTNSVHVGNLQFYIEWQELKDLFRLCGHVENVSVKTDRQGNSRGFAYITYHAAYEAVQAVCMLNNQQFCGRDLHVALDRDGPPAPDVPKHLLAQTEAHAHSLLPHLLNQLKAGELLDARTLAEDLRLRTFPTGIHGVSKGFGIMGLPLRGAKDIEAWIDKVTQINTSPGKYLPGSYKESFERRYLEQPSSSEPSRSREELPAVPRKLSGLQALISAAMAGGMREEEVLEAAASITGRDGRSRSNGRRGNDRHEPEHSSRGRFRKSFERRSENDSKIEPQGKFSYGVIVKNLPAYYTWHRLSQLFQPIGKIQRAEIITDDDKTCQCCGCVYFYNIEAAEEAVKKFDGILVGDNEIHVELA